MEREYELCLSHDYPFELEWVEPDELLETLEYENMDPTEATAQIHLKAYERSILDDQAQKQAHETELERYIQQNILILQQNDIEQTRQIATAVLIQQEDSTK